MPSSRSLVPSVNERGHRDLFPGMGQAVAERTVLRRVRQCAEEGCGEIAYRIKRRADDPDDLQRWECRWARPHTFTTVLSDPGERWEAWGEVADRVALGSSLLCDTEIDMKEEWETLKDHVSRGLNLMSGRHLQHGDWTQARRSSEVYINCATSPTSFLSFLLLLSGSGVGRCYDDDFMLMSWDNAPSVRCVLSTDHPDFDWNAGMESQREARHKYASGRDVMWFDVPDNREGWAKALETWENAAFEKVHKDKLLVLDFSKVRPKGSPIEGMQGRPSSGPVPLMNAFLKAASIRGAGLPRWLQALYVDHYFAECVLVGGARRAARMATKWWRDETVIDFVKIKRPIEFEALQHADIAQYRDELDQPLQGFLWSANNSVTVDAEFWRLVDLKQDDAGYGSDDARHARAVFEAVTKCSYHDGTGEPGFINVDRLVRNDDGWDALLNGRWCGSKKYQVCDESLIFLSRLAKRAGEKQYNMIVNPCVTGETLVNTAAGSVSIRELAERGAPFETFTASGEPTVGRAWRTGRKPVFRATFAEGFSLRCTADHKLVTPAGGKIALKDLKIGDPGSCVLLGGSDARDRKAVRLEAVEPDGVEDVYDVSVEHDEHTYIANGLAISNCSEICLTLIGGFCVEGSTRILTRDGYGKIADLVGKTVEVFNGEEWSETTVRQTGSGRDLLRVRFSDGSYLDCTPEHEFSVRKHRQASTMHKVSARDLQSGWCMPTFRADAEIRGEALADAYTYGVFLGDGSVEARSDCGGCRYIIALYRGKHHLPVTGTRGRERRNGSVRVTVSHLDHERLLGLKGMSLPEWVYGLDRRSIMEFVAGWVDADGTHHKDFGGISIDMGSEDRARGLQLLLRRAGFSFVSIRQTGNVGDKTNLGIRKSDMWRVYIPATEAGMIQAGHRVASDHPVDLDACVRQARVVSVEALPGKHDVFCFAEKKRGMGVFGNALTYQCVLADLVPFHADSLEDAEGAFRAATRAMIRVNTMDSVYSAEVRRTNRIGIGLTGIHEFAWKFFGFSFSDLLDEDRARPFWLALARFRRAVADEAATYSARLRLPRPHTDTTIKPSGCRPAGGLVTTDAGLLTLDEILAGHAEDAAWSDMPPDAPMAERDGGAVRISRTYRNGTAPLLRIKMSYGMEVESTEDHPWRLARRTGPDGVHKAVDEWVRAGDVRPGDVLEVSSSRAYRNEAPAALFQTAPGQPTAMSEDLAWLLGLLHGSSSSLHASGTLEVGSATAGIIGKVERVVREGLNVDCSSDVRDGAAAAHAPGLFAWAAENGALPKGREVVPACIRRSSWQHVVAFVAGMIDADGVCVREATKTLRLPVRSAALAGHLQDVAWAAGLTFSRRAAPAGDPEGVPGIWLLSLGVHAEAASVDVLVRNSLRAAEADGMTSVRWRHEAASKTAHVVGQVRSVEPAGPAETFDVEVPDGNWYWAGAVKSHNSVSKLFGLTEGAHLPAMRYFLRWVQFRDDDPLVAEYRKRGYPTRRLRSYEGTTIVGFPTAPVLTMMGLGDRLVTAAEATPEQQYAWLRLLEKYWIHGTDDQGMPLPENRGGQVSYSLKYNPDVVPYDEFAAMVREHQRHVRCCSVMPQTDVTSHEYQPEEPIDEESFRALLSGIDGGAMAEAVDVEHVDCAGSLCPISFRGGDAAESANAEVETEVETETAM